MISAVTGSTPRLYGRQHSMVWYGMVWYGMVWYGMVWYGMVWRHLCAGGPSMRILIQRICMALSGLSKPIYVSERVSECNADVMYNIGWTSYYKQNADICYRIISNRNIL